MTPWLLLLLTMLLLSIPGWLLRSGRGAGRGDDLGEIRGPLRWVHRGFQAYAAIWHGLRADRYAPLPASGPAILIANHTCGIDHMLLQAASRRLLGFMVAREYFESPWLNWICVYIGCIPVNRDGRDLAAIRAALRALGQGRVLPIFPEGTIVPASGYELGPMRPGTAYIAVRARVPVVPAYILGTPRTNEILESLATPSRARIVFGAPIDLSDIPPHRAGDKAVQAEVSARFEAALRALRAQAVAAEEDGDATVARG
jgi:1-acyl-sn-glycerol-3-phosphate acyltransferase